MIEITSEDFSVDDVLKSMKKRVNGAIVSFVGIVRGENEGKSVDRIEVQAYKEMALRQLKDIRKEALQKFGVNQITIIHRVGVLEVSDNIVLIAVGGAHRDESFKACRFVLEQLKAKAPLWKKEFTTDGSYWVEDKRSE
jgi:molybdopterin synthase catalytic subunit